MPIPNTDPAVLGTLFKTGMVIHVVVMVILLLITRTAMRRAVRRDTPINGSDTPNTIPVMIPVGSVLSQTELALRSLLEQEHIVYRVMLITATENEEAATIIKKLCKEYRHATHVVAGKANRCAQKNHNLLAAVAQLKPDEDILVFCDSTHVARPDFLIRLTAPLASGRALLSSGYRFVRPGDHNLGTLVQMLAVQTLHMLWSIRPISQPWGGATAIARSVFFENRIPDLWSRTVVDDYSMGPYLQDLGIRSLPVPEASLETSLSGQSVTDASKWFYRQLQFFKFHTPLTWAIASTIPIFYLGILIYALATLPGSTIYFCTVALLSLWYTSVIPNTAPALKRVAAYFLFTIVAAAQLLHTWTSNSIHWQNITYKVKLGGEILDIRRTERTDA